MKLKHTKVATLAATLITFGSLAGGANAAVTVTTSGSGSGGDISITFSAVDFLATSNFTGGSLGLAFDEALPDSGNDFGNGNFSGPSLGGGAITFYADSGFTGAAALTANDPYICLLYTSDAADE